MTNMRSINLREFGAGFPRDGELHSIDVFVAGSGGGSPVPFVADARLLSGEQMLAVARATGHESAFILDPISQEADLRLRFFVPKQEMEMCGHATVGTLWALRQWGRWTSETARVETLSGLVDVLWDPPRRRVWVSQPAVRVEPLTSEGCSRVAAVLGISSAAVLQPMVNATTSRAKTLVQLPTAETLHALKPDFSAMEALCAEIGSTGLYPFVATDGDGSDDPVLMARQFPKASGYPEDPATGIAAAALWGHLAASGAIRIGTADAPIECVVRQGEAMARPSAISVRARFDAKGRRVGCWISGHVQWSA